MKKAAVLWLTGYSGAGKTTIANNIVSCLQQKNGNPIFLDGDVMRTILKHTGFDERSRKAYNLLIGQLVSLLERNNQFVIVALISPYRETRDEIKKLCKRFIEVHVSADLETCKARDPKGLYKKALAGEIENFTGISAPYEMPLQPELVLNTAVLTETDSTNILLAYLQTNEYI
jgi:adenylylsulfate kinase